MEYAEYDTEALPCYSEDDEEGSPDRGSGGITDEEDDGGDAGLLGALTSIIVGGVTDLLTDLSPHPTSRGGGGATTSNTTTPIHRRGSRTHSPESGFGRDARRSSGTGGDFAGYSETRHRASTTTVEGNSGGGEGGWIIPPQRSRPGAAGGHTPFSASTPPQRGRYRGGTGDVAPANSLVGSPTAGAGLLGAVFSGFSTLGQRATDMLTQLDHGFDSIFNGALDQEEEGEQGDPRVTSGAPATTITARNAPQEENEEGEESRRGRRFGDGRGRSKGGSGGGDVPATTGLGPQAGDRREVVVGPVVVPITSGTGKGVECGLGLGTSLTSPSLTRSASKGAAGAPAAAGGKVGSGFVGGSSSGGVGGGEGTTSRAMQGRSSSGTGRSAGKPSTSGWGGRGTGTKNTDDDWGWGASSSNSSDEEAPSRGATLQATSSAPPASHRQASLSKQQQQPVATSVAGSRGGAPPPSLSSAASSVSSVPLASSSSTLTRGSSLPLHTALSGGGSGGHALISGLGSPPASAGGRMGAGRSGGGKLIFIKSSSSVAPTPTPAAAAAASPAAVAVAAPRTGVAAPSESSKASTVCGGKAAAVPHKGSGLSTAAAAQQPSAPETAAASTAVSGGMAVVSGPGEPLVLQQQQQQQRGKEIAADATAHVDDNVWGATDELAVALLRQQLQDERWVHSATCARAEAAEARVSELQAQAAAARVASRDREAHLTSQMAAAEARVSELQSEAEAWVSEVRLESEARVSEMQCRLDAALAEAGRLGRQVGELQEELATRQRRCDELEQEIARLRRDIQPLPRTAGEATGGVPPASPATAAHHLAAHRRNRSPSLGAAACGGTPLAGLDIPRSPGDVPCLTALSPSLAAVLSGTGRSHQGSRPHSRHGSRGHSRRGSLGGGGGAAVAAAVPACRHVYGGAAGGGGAGAGAGGGSDELVEATLVAQLTAALADKARLWQENDILNRRLQGLQELLAYMQQAGFGQDEGSDDDGRGDDTAVAGYGYAVDGYDIRGEHDNDAEGDDADYHARYWRTGSTPPPGPLPFEAAAAVAGLGQGLQYGIEGCIRSSGGGGSDFVVAYGNLLYEGDDARYGSVLCTPPQGGGGGASSSGPGTLASSASPATARQYGDGACGDGAGGSSVADAASPSYTFEAFGDLAPAGPAAVTSPPRVSAAEPAAEVSAALIAFPPLPGYDDVQSQCPALSAVSEPLPAPPSRNASYPDGWEVLDESGEVLAPPPQPQQQQRTAAAREAAAVTLPAGPSGKGPACLAEPGSVGPGTVPGAGGLAVGAGAAACAHPLARPMAERTNIPTFGPAGSG